MSISMSLAMVSRNRLPFRLIVIKCLSYCARIFCLMDLPEFNATPIAHKVVRRAVSSVFDSRICLLQLVGPRHL